MVEAEAEHRVAVLEQGQVHGGVGVGAGVGLHIGVVGAEEGLGPLRQVLGLVDHLVAAVVPPPRVALGVLVGHHRACGRSTAGETKFSDAMSWTMVLCRSSSRSRMSNSSGSSSGGGYGGSLARGYLDPRAVG